MRLSFSAAKKMLSNKKDPGKTSGNLDSCLEKYVIRACVDYMTLKGYIVIRNNSGRMFVEGETGKTRMVKFGETGSPDIVACSPEGRFVAVECKGPKGKLSEHQKAFLERLRLANSQTIVARSVEDLVKAGI